MIEPIVDLAWLRLRPETILVDVRWYLDGRSGREAYAAGHIPGAVFIDLDAALAGPPSAEAGRHPLPRPDIFADAMAAAGISHDSIVVAYDDAGGASAARFVWLLRMVGVGAALLDGGLSTWPEVLATEGAPPARGRFEPLPWNPARLATMEQVLAAAVVLDARAPERYRGEVEPIDARAGHIPGAVNMPFADNLDGNGRFLSADALRARFLDAGVSDDVETVVYCGSGVTACHDLLAMERAGFGLTRLYPGSWSEYANSSHPAATGDDTGP